MPARACVFARGGSPVPSRRSEGHPTPRAAEGKWASVPQHRGQEFAWPPRERAQSTEQGSSREPQVRRGPAHTWVSAPGDLGRAAAGPGWPLTRRALGCAMAKLLLPKASQHKKPTQGPRAPSALQAGGYRPCIREPGTLQRRVRGCPSPAGTDTAAFPSGLTHTPVRPTH